MAPLPSSKEVQDAVASGDAEAAQKLLEILAFGTEIDAAGDLNERTKDACNVLVTVWKDCPELEDFLVDALWLRGCVLTSSPSKAGSEDAPPADTLPPSVDALIEIIKAIIEVPGRKSFYVKLQNNLLPSLLAATGLASEEDLLKRLRIHNTQVNYKQQKYNLLQEESEGYAKVLQFLQSGSLGEENEQICRFRQLLGAFELDPNRVMDLMIDTLESKLYPHGVEHKEGGTQKPEKNEVVARLLGMLRLLPIGKLPSLLNFKLSSHSAISQGLLRTTTFLATEGLLDLSVMIEQYCSPIENDIEEAHKVLWMKEKKRIQALTRINLSGATKEDPKLVELKERLLKAVIPLSSNPVISILLIILHWGEWHYIESLLSPVSWEYLCNLLPERFGFAFCDMAQRRLQPFFRAKVGTPGLSNPWQTNEEAPASVDPGLDDVVESVSAPLRLVVDAGCMGVRPVLYCQLCRVLRSILEEQGPEHTLSDQTYDFFKRFLVPTLSLFPSNPAISTELWSVLKCLPYATRYRLYEDWKGIGLEREGLGASYSSGKSLPVVESEINAGKAARYALKRLSKDNIRDMSRQLAKVTHACPLVVYGTILNQIESYDNMVEVMVEAQRFSNPLGLDVLGFCILSRLSGTSGGVNRNRLKEDGVNVSQWLQSLEAFSGEFFKRYPFVEFRGILAYLMRRLREGHVMELGILGTLIKVAGGYSFADYSPAASLSATQLEGRAGSFTLKRETMSFGIVEEMNFRATDIIKEVLQRDGFGVSMLILIAQARARIVFESSKGAPKPVKLVGNLYDSCQVVISILLEFLTTDEPKEGDEKTGQAIEEYAKQLPTLDDLHFKYGLDVECAWMLNRPLARNAVTSKEREVAETISPREKYENMLPEDAWSHLSPALFEFFYTSSVYDIFFPEEVYAAESGRISKEIERNERNKASGAPAAVPVGPNPSKNEAAELARLNRVSKLLMTEKDKQKDHVDAIRATLETKIGDLMNSDVVSQQAAKALFLYCVYPRSLLSPDDAMYCAHFALQLHKIETPGFSTLHYMDELISVVSGSLFGLTEAEAANLAILLWQTWTVVNKWRYEEGLYDSEVLGKPGSYMEVSNILEGDVAEQASPREVSHKDFIALYNTWHATLGTALIGCLKSVEYMHMRTGLVILTRIVEVFPTRPRLGNKLITALEPLQDENSARPDIRTSANAYCTMLLRARDDGKWIEEDAAVAKARADKDRAAAEERKKKLEEQFEELQRDSEKITEEIGPRDGFDRRRDARPFGGPNRGAGPPPPDRGRGGHPPPPSRENGEMVGRDSRDHPDRRSPARETERRREWEGGRSGDRGHGRGDSLPNSAVRSGERHPSERGRRDGGGRADDRDGGRWVRGETAPPAVSATRGNGGRGSKRGRSRSPEPGSDDRGNPKRARVEPEAGFDSRKESSPPRRGRSGPDTSKSRARRSRR